MKRRLFSLGTLLATLTILAMTGCHDAILEDNRYPDSSCEAGTSAEGEQDVEVVLDIPEMLQSTSLRSLSPDQESDAKAIRILAFNVPAGATQEEQETYTYEPRIKKGPELRDGKYYVTLKLNEGAAPQRLVLLANLPGGKLPAAVTEGATKKAVYESLVYEYAATGWRSNGEKTNAAQGTDYDLIPMWGESRTFSVVAGENTIKDYYYDDGVIRLYRALARVDVGMNFDTAVNSTDPLPETNEGMDKTANRLFDLTDVYVYHSAKKYRMAGSMANISNPDGKYKAVAPTLPAGVEYYTGKTAAELKMHYTVDPNKGHLVRSIYLPEAAVVKSGNVKEELDGNACIVVGGVYKGNNFNPKGKENKTTTYYRIDFVKAKEKGEDKESRLPILRNYRYRINILKIDGPGHKTPEDAINNTSSDVIYSVSVWDENETSKVVTDGKYWLKLSSDQLKVGKYGGTLPITFETNCPEGWELIVPDKYADDPLNHPERLIDNPLAKAENKEWVKTILNQQIGAVAGRKSTQGKETKPETVDFEIKKQTDPTFKGMEGAFIVQTYGGRLNWTVRIRQTPKLDLLLEIYKDKEMTQQINFIEVHEGGWSFDKTITVDGKKFSPKDQGSYTVFYVRALPYGPLSGEDKLDGWDLTVTDSGGDDFKFWSYVSPWGMEPFRYPGPDKRKADVGFRDNDFLSFNTHYEGKGHIPHMFKQVGHNLYELAISNDAMTNAKEPFELRRNKYTFTLTVTDPADATKKESISKSINVIQQEHNIVLYTDEELTKKISYDEKHPQFYLMNGKDKQIYVKSNLPGYIKLLRQGQDPRVRGTAEQDPKMIPMEQIVGSTADYKAHTIDKTTLQANISKTQDIYYFPANLGTEASRNKYTFTTRNDIEATKKLNWGYADWIVNTSDPFFKWKFDDGKEEGDNFRTEFVCVAVQPEANCYVLELDNYGIFIPLSRINTAADTFYDKWEKPDSWDEYIVGGKTGESRWVRSYKGPINWDDFKKEENHGLHHLDDDDDVTPEFIWTDYDPLTRKLSSDNVPLFDPTSMSNSHGPIRALDIVEVAGERYLYVVPGEDKEVNKANTLIAVRSSKYTKKPTGIPEVDGGTVFPGNRAGSKAILWSWHIITVPKGKRADYLALNKFVTLELEEVDGNYITWDHPGLLFQELGARKRADISTATGGWRTGLGLAWQPDDYDVLGMVYQWGRKDPFPKENYDGLKGESNLKFPFLKDASGKRFRTEWYGDTGRSYRFTYKQSIENPTVAVRANADGDEHWMVEGGWETSNGPQSSMQKYQVSFIWGGKILGASTERESSTNETDKTVWDPCPYGFKVPSIGAEVGMPYKEHNSQETDEAAVRKAKVRARIGANRAKPLTNGYGSETYWNGPLSGNGYEGAGSTRGKYVHFHSSCPVYGGMGRSGAWELKTTTDYYSGGGVPINLSGKAAVLPIFPIYNWKEHDYDQYWKPRARSIGVSNNR